ncbi:MAG: FHA domain-containing protein, partial [Myxococcota bacterium]
MSEPVVQVFVFRDGAYVGSEVFSEPELVLGSGEGADLWIDDPSVGDAHAILAREGTELRLLDLGHAGGTRVNGNAIEHANIGARDEIGIGRHLLKVKLVRPRSDDLAASRRPAPAPAPAASSRPKPVQERSIKTEVVRKRSSADIDALLAEELDGLFGEEGAEATHGPETQVTSMDAAYGSVDEALADAFASTTSPPPEPQASTEEPATVRAPLEELQADHPNPSSAPLPEFLDPGLPIERPSEALPVQPPPAVSSAPSRTSAPAARPSAAISSPRIAPAQTTAPSVPRGARTSSSGLPPAGHTSSSSPPAVAKGSSPGLPPARQSSSLPSPTRSSSSGLEAAASPSLSSSSHGLAFDPYDIEEDEDPDAKEAREAPGFSLLESL